jgi:hypothetical protein
VIAPVPTATQGEREDFCLLRIVRGEAVSMGEQGWQPIETAPKDGTRILVFAKWMGGSERAVVWWGPDARDNFSDGIWHAGFATTYVPEVVTHWMPLPEPPK